MLQPQLCASVEMKYIFFPKTQCKQRQIFQSPSNELPRLDFIVEGNTKTMQYTTPHFENNLSEQTFLGGIFTITITWLTSFLRHDWPFTPTHTHTRTAHHIRDAFQLTQHCY